MGFAKKMVMAVMDKFSRCQEAFEDCVLLSESELSHMNCSSPAAKVWASVAYGPSPMAAVHIRIPPSDIGLSSGLSQPDHT